MLTWIMRRVGELDGFAVHAIWKASQEDVDLHFLIDVQVLIGRRLEDDGYLTVDIRLGKLSLGLPRPPAEDDLYVIWVGFKNAF